MRLRLIAVAFAGLLLHCTDLSHVDVGTCGNGVVDDGEDCDTFPIADADASVDPTSKKLACGTSGASACRYVCTTSAQCPAGWGCSIDGTCRAPTGTFPRASEALSTGVTSLVAGDFDGDGRKDVLATGARGADGSARARVHYFGDGAALEKVTPLAFPLASPSVRDFDGDGIDDFAFGVGGLGALGILTGQSDRSFIPVMFPSIPLPGVIDGKPVQLRAPLGTSFPSGRPFEYLLIGRVETQALKGSVLVGDLNGSGGGYHKLLTYGPDEINGVPLGARLFTADPTSACGEVILARVTGDIEIYSPCRLTPGSTTLSWANDRDPVVLHGMDPTSTVVVANVDDDPFPDLVFKSAGKKDSLVVRLGNGTGFPEDSAHVLLDAIPGGEVPLAAGDLNGDNRTDFVTPSGLVVRTPAGADAGAPDAGAGPALAYSFADVPRRSRWTMAVIGDLNGDKLPDLLAASSDLPDVDFYSGSPSGQFAGSTIPTDGPVSALTLADLDGDTLTDVVYVEGKAGSSTTDVTVAYGRAYGAPEEPRKIGRLADIAAIDTLANFWPNHLAVFLKEQGADGSPSYAVALVAGSGDRQPLAPLALLDDNAITHFSRPTPTAGRQWTPVSVHAGPFRDPKVADLFTLAIGYTFDNGKPLTPFPAGIWGALGTGTAVSFTTANELGELPPQIAAVDRNLAGQVPNDAGDVDGDGLLDIVAVAHPQVDPKPVLVVNHSASKDPSGGAPVSIAANVTVNPQSLVRLLDVDGDGKLDIVTVLPDVTAGKGTHAFVFLNDGKGNFTGVPVEVVLPDNEGKPADIVDVALVTTGGASANGKGTAHTELAVLAAKRCVLASIRPDRSGFDVKEMNLSGLQGATGIVAADLDGDGVQDLAIADNGSLRVYRQKAKQDKVTP